MGDELNFHRFPPASRSYDPVTSVRAGDRVQARGWSALHEAVIAALRAHEMTDKELENQPQFQGYQPSTVRKRRSELFQAKRLAANGERDGLQVWRVAG